MYILHVQNRYACQWQWAWFKINSPYLQWVGFFFNLRKVLSIREEIWPGIENMTGVCFVVDYFYRQINIHVRRTQNRALITFCFAKVWMIRLLNYTAFPLIKMIYLGNKKWFCTIPCTSTFVLQYFTKEDQK